MRRLFALAFFTFAPAARAQWVYEPSMSWPEVATMNQFGLLKAQSDAAAKGVGRNAPSRNVPSHTVPSHTEAGAAAASPLAYTPSLERRRALLARVVAHSRAAGSAEEAQTARLLTATDVIAAVGKQVAPYGLRTDDVGDAYAVWCVTLWQVAHADTATPSRAAMRAVRAQVGRVLGSVPRLRAATDSAKQEYAEGLLMQAVLVSASAAEARGNAARAGQMGVVARQAAGRTGVDLDAMTLTEAGFAPAARRGVAGPATVP